MVLLCLADIHGQAAGLGELIAGPPRADIVILAGDITHLGGREDAERVLSPVLSSGTRLLAVGGNMDRESVRAYLGELGVDLHARGVRIDDVGFLGLGGGTPSPFGTPWELGDEEASRCLAAGADQVRGAPFTVLVSHPPPRGTDLDKSFAHLHVGSGAVKKFLDAGGADLCICGHIHEAAGEQRVGAAWCVNVGPYKNGNYARVRIEGGRANVDRRTR